MQQRTRWIALVMGIFFLAVMPGLAADDVTLEGEFIWERDDGARDGALKAVLTPNEGGWDVAFHFDWEDEPHVYSGTCKGSLDGEMTGNVKADGGRDMQFKFEGAFRDGKFSGDHFFIGKDGEIKKAGTMTLAAAAG